MMTMELKLELSMCRLRGLTWCDSHSAPQGSPEHGLDVTAGVITCWSPHFIATEEL